MNVYEFAQKTELEAEKRYRDLANSAPSSGMKDVFSILADSERRHLEIIGKLERGEDADLSEFKIAGDVREILEKLVPNKERFDLAGSRIDAYLEASKSEAESEQFYRNEARKTRNPGQRPLLLALAEEEHQHLFIIDKMILMIGKP